MDLAFLGESKLLIGLGMVAIAIVVLSIMLRKWGSALKDRTTDDRH